MTIELLLREGLACTAFAAISLYKVLGCGGEKSHGPGGHSGRQLIKKQALNRRIKLGGVVLHLELNQLGKGAVKTLDALEQRYHESRTVITVLGDSRDVAHSGRHGEESTGDVLLGLFHGLRVDEMGQHLERDEVGIRQSEIDRGLNRRRDRAKFLWTAKALRRVDRCDSIDNR